LLIHAPQNFRARQRLTCGVRKSSANAPIAETAEPGLSPLDRRAGGRLLVGPVLFAVWMNATGSTRDVAPTYTIDAFGDRTGNLIQAEPARNALSVRRGRRLARNRTTALASLRVGGLASW
jgi:hypothetical protein